MEKMGQIDFWQQSPEKQVEQLRRFGEGYRYLIDRALGAQAVSADMENDPVLKKIERSASAFVAEQAHRQAERNLDAAGFLRQVFTSQEQQKVISESVDNVRLEALSPGLYAVYLEPKLMRHLRPGAQAVAARVRDGVSFLMLQELPADDEYMKRYEEENMPHETHHLIWASVVNAGSFPSRESDQDFATAFQVFRDEFMARAVSSGGLAGYTHIHSLSPDARAELEVQSPGKADRIIQKVAELNGQLHELDEAIRKSEKVSKPDLLKVAVEARTFDELENGIKKVKALCDQFPKKDEPPTQKNSWTNVPV